MQVLILCHPERSEGSFCFMPNRVDTFKLKKIFRYAQYNNWVYELSYCHTHYECDSVPAKALLHIFLSTFFKNICWQ
ncbi:MAG: hypothetical protein JWP44_2974 [Mucilaginibacter sp.]|nr:hypothetical protein [Mucilaginibacter sp.]